MTKIDLRVGDRLTFFDLARKIGVAAVDYTFKKDRWLVSKHGAIYNPINDTGYRIHFDIVEGNENTFVYNFIVEITEINPIW